MKRTALALVALCAAPAAAATLVMLPTLVIAPASYWGVDDPEPMVVTYGPEGPAFSRLGDEQCMDKLLGTMPCDMTIEMFETQNESISPLLLPKGFQKPSDPAVPPVIIEPPPCCDPPPPCCEPPPPAPVSLAGTAIFVLSGVSALVLLAAYRKKGQA